MSSNPQLEILDLRHFSAAQLTPLLRDEAAHWQQRLHWDYTQATSIVLDYLDGRILPGFVALDPGTRRVLGYGFCVFEGAKAVIGDIYAFGEAASTTNPTGDTLLRHMLEMLQATPGVDRIESQLLMYPAGAFTTPFRDFGFQCRPRLFMTSDLSQLATNARHSDFAANARHLDRSPTALSSGVAESGAPSERSLFDGVQRPLYLASPQPSPDAIFRHHNLTLHTWHPAFYDAAAGLIHRCYTGHMDSGINDQYQTYAGAQRFLHNIIRFPGCGLFDAENSFVLRDARTQEMKATLLSSRIRPDVAHITQLCVAPALRGQGIGQALLQHCATRSAARGLTSLSLTVTEANTPAQTLYRAHGFTTLHRFDAMVWDKNTAPPL